MYTAAASQLCPSTCQWDSIVVHPSEFEKVVQVVRCIVRKWG